MIKAAVLVLCIVNVCLASERGAGEGVFFREYWAEWDEAVSNHPGRLRVNDTELSLHPRYGKRSEARANGLMLINVPEDLFELERAELYLELWGGHPGTARKRVILNGRKTYALPEVGTEEQHCTYSYPTVPLDVLYLVSGVNAFQFACDRGRSFWGHFIIDNASVRAYLKPTHPDLAAAGLDGSEAQVRLAGADGVLADEVEVSLTYPKELEESIESVDYFVRCLDYDDNGDGETNDWHGFTQKRKPRNHVGSSDAPPFRVVWDTTMVPTQQRPMALKAVVHLRDAFHYFTPVVDGLRFPAHRHAVSLYAPAELPAPFWSRANRLKTLTIELPQGLSTLERARLYLKVWDGGQGTVEHAFTINGHPYDVVSGRAVHDVVFTATEVDLAHLKPGVNEIALLSDTQHHGIEVLLPGPCFVLRFRE